MALYFIKYKCPRCGREELRKIGTTKYYCPVDVIFHCPECNAYLHMKYKWNKGVCPEEDTTTLFSVEEYLRGESTDRFSDYSLEDWK
jgi:hypothetical protein